MGLTEFTLRRLKLAAEGFYHLARCHEFIIKPFYLIVKLNVQSMLLIL
jgi:hypothetical protein